MVTWQSYGQDPNLKRSGWGVYARKFDINGNAVTDEIRVNHVTYGSQSDPVTQVLSNGNVAIAYQGFEQMWPGNYGFGIFMRIYDGNMNPVTMPIQASYTNFLGDQQFDLAALPNGGVAMAYESAASPDQHGIYLRKFDANGATDSPMWLVNQYHTNGRQWMPAIDTNAMGKIAVTWTSDSGDGSGKTVYAQVFNQDLTHDRAAVQVAETWRGTQWQSDVQWLGDDGFVVSWAGRGGNDLGGVFLRQFDSLSQPQGAELRMSDSKIGVQKYAKIEAGVNGLVATWHGKGAEDSFGIYSRGVTNMASDDGLISISGTVFDDINGNGIREGVLIQGDSPDVIFLVDVSGSTIGNFQGGSVGDLNNDGSSNTILDAEIAGFEVLVDELIRLGFGDVADVSVVTYASSANRATPMALKPNTDADGNGVSDIKDALRSLRDGGTTNYEAGLNEAIDVFTELGTTPENGNVIFLSDGEPSSQNYLDEIPTLRGLANNIRAFGVGSGADDVELRNIDPNARIFTTTDELLGAFGGLNGGGGGVIPGPNMMNSEPGLAGITVYLDRNNNGVLDMGEERMVSRADNPMTAVNELGTYRFDGLAPGNYVIRQMVPGDRTGTSPATDFYDIDLTAGLDRGGLDFGSMARNDLA